MAFPVDSNYFEQYAAIYYGDTDVAGVQHPQPSIVDDVQDNVKQLCELTSVKYGEQYLLEKTSHTCSPMVREAGIISVSWDFSSSFK